MKKDPHPYEYRGTNTCDQCGCRWQADDLSKPNPIEDLCYEPLKWHPRGCLCHSEVYVMAYLDERDRLREERLLDI